MNGGAHQHWRDHIRLMGAAYFIFAASLAMTLTAWTYATRTFEAQDRTRFDDVAREMYNEIRERVDTYILTLEHLRALFEASESVERDEFQAYLRAVDLGRRYPGIKGVGFIRRVSVRDADAFISQVRHDTRIQAAGYPDFRIFPRGAGGEHFVVDFIEPFATNQTIFGLDMYAEPVRRAAMEQARDTGLPTATERITLLENFPTAQPGFNIVVPIYRNGAVLNTLDRRRTALAGYVFGRFEVTDLLGGIFGRHPHQQVAFEIFDGLNETAENRIHETNVASARNNLSQSIYQHSAVLDVAGRPWTLRFTPLQPFGLGPEKDTAHLILIGGGVVSILLFGITWIQARTSTERRVHTEAIGHQSAHDALTGLPNRISLYENLMRAIPETDRAGGDLALLLIDLNGFKEINDTLGHQSGDNLLRQIGPRLKQQLEPLDTVARLGGDEFAVLLRSGSGRAHVAMVARRLLEAIRESFDLSGLKVQMGASIGIALYPQHGNNSSMLMRCADVAMYVAKKSSEGYAIYDPEIDTYSPRRLALVSELGEAIKGNQLVLHYQPIINVKSGALVSVEALVRWQHPTHGLVPPDQFIPVAEKSELIHPLTTWVVDNALDQARRWQALGFDTKVDVNISARNLQDSDLPEKIGGLLEKHGIRPHRLGLEITESALILDPTRSFDTLSRLHGRGLAIAIDDFGTGYSSLAYLKKLPVKSLKIDRSFVTDIERDDNDAVIVHSTINLAHNLGLKVIAEGVEDKEVLDLLEILECDEAQGYYLSRPMVADVMTDWMKKRGLRRMRQVS